MRINLFVPLAVAAGLTASFALPAQTVTDSSGSSSPNYFSESKASADGGAAQSVTYALTATVGQGEPADASSATYSLVGGFIGTLDAVSTEPWLTAARPILNKPRNPKLVWLSGSRLDLANVPTVMISGTPATIVAKSQTDVAIQLPSFLDPGWHEITYTNGGGTTSLERGLGILPMIYTDRAPAAEKAFDIVFKGTPNDFVFWAVAFQPGPKFPIGQYLHGITLSATFFRVLTPFTIPANTDEVRFSVPPTVFGIDVYVQGLFLNMNPNSGYDPGSFTNMLKF